MGHKLVKRFSSLEVLLLFAIFSGHWASDKVKKSSGNVGENSMLKKINPDEVTTEWNDSYLFNSKEDALEKLGSLKNKSEEINQTFRPEFERLSGSVLLEYLETQKEFSRSIENSF